MSSNAKYHTCPRHGKESCNAYGNVHSCSKAVTSLQEKWFEVIQYGVTA